MQNRREAHVLLGEGSGENLEMFLLRKTLSWLINSNMVKPEKFDHLHFVYHFIVPLNSFSNFNFVYKFWYLLCFRVMQ